MAQNIRLRHAQSGIIKTGFYGFSWTTLFFSGFPAIFRGDLITGVIVLILSASSFWLVAIIWAFLYNRVYTTRLLERGYIFDDDPEKSGKPSVLCAFRSNPVDAAFPLRHPQTGEFRQGYYRFSRDTLRSLGVVWFERGNASLAILNSLFAVLTVLPLALCLPQTRDPLLSGTTSGGTLGQPLLIGLLAYACVAVTVFFLGLRCTLRARTLRYGKFSGATALPLLLVSMLWYDQGYVTLLGDDAGMIFGGIGAFMGLVGLLRAAADSNALHSLALMRQGYVALPDPHRDEALIAL